MTLDLSIPILVVDRYTGMIRIIRRLLKQLDFQHVDDACDGTAALARLKERKYGLAICDFELVRGYDLLKHVRADEVLWNLPFIMVTEGTYNENLTATKKAGVSTYIVKPFDARTLKNKIEAEMTNRRRLVRHRVMKRGELAFDRGAHTLGCLIRDISEGGARIHVANAEALPSELLLSFDGGGAPRPCLVRWRRGNALGIEFTDTGSAPESS